MEIYAAMIERMDMQIGRLLRYLETSGQIDNTLVVFLSDNGPDSTVSRAGLGGGGPCPWRLYNIKDDLVSLVQSKSRKRPCSTV